MMLFGPLPPVMQKSTIAIFVHIAMYKLTFYLVMYFLGNVPNCLLIMYISRIVGFVDICIVFVM